MGKGEGSIKGILAYITTDKNRYLGGEPLALLVKDKEELVKISDTIAETFLADIVELSNGDYMIIKK
ncbi:conserved hypothetical protein [Alkaliphilus metalliredigens QYMF]|uniref:Uncharacterized protein n=1 Tax=Alkaliphilus metalliredigens (strain QYMF) TaxID=293826 RepID=A6TTF2_ALKMQ|nr:hypothetical protein [Alkaliphilus metalliredigens]ABR49470.1 conserved hypothetical protein [Alkaliphilus metalliredigens QYMF]